MTHLGTFGKEKPAAEESVTFDWFGKTVRSSPTLGELDLIDFMHVAGSIDTKSSASLGFVKDFATSCIHVDDFADFWRLARENRQDSADLFEVLTSIVEAVTDRPTKQPSDSSDGQPTTGARSTVDSSLRAQSRLEAQGRPDLALVVAETREFLAG